jgi:hypothetical protein
MAMDAFPFSLNALSESERETGGDFEFAVSLSDGKRLMVDANGYRVEEGALIFSSQPHKKVLTIAAGIWTTVGLASSGGGIWPSAVRHVEKSSD